MRFLLDTNIVLFWLQNRKLSKQAFRAISNREHILYVSSISVFEIEQKIAAGKLKIPSDYYDSIEKEKFTFLPLDPIHARTVSRLPLHHRDPFDRLLIAQALSESLTVISTDDNFGLYDIRVIEG